MEDMISATMPADIRLSSDMDMEQPYCECKIVIV